MKNSIFFSFSLIFFITICGLSVIFSWFISYDKQNYTNELNSKYTIFSRAFLLNKNGIISDFEYNEQVKNFNLKSILNPLQKYEILANGEVLDEISTNIGNCAIISYKKQNFLQISHFGNIILLKDYDFFAYRYDISKLIFGFIIFTFIFCFVFVIKKIRPLAKLKKEIKKFANGNLDIKNISTGKDEISDVATAFYEAVNQIKATNESRKLFLRNIMHELKTPITKGRITTEMIYDDKNKQRLIQVFERLENLINEFALIEQITSGFIKLNPINSNLQDIIDEAIDIAMCDKNRVKFCGENLSLFVDFKFFSIAVKNMIDNALKYSQNRQVEIYADKNEIIFASFGERLKEDLSFYKEPFSKGKNAKHSFGLGLYIVDNILKNHKFSLNYEYKDGKNLYKFCGILQK